MKLRLLFFILSITFFNHSSVFGQCEIEISNVDYDSVSNILATRQFEGCVKYIANRKNQLRIYADRELGEVLEIIQINESATSISITVRNALDVIIVYKFYTSINRLDTIIASNRTFIIETGNGLTYKIAKRIKGTGRNYSMKTI